MDATARLMDKVERIYFRERFVKHGDRNELKRAFLKEYGITGRQLSNTVRLAYVIVSLYWSRFDGYIYKTTYF